MKPSIILTKGEIRKIAITMLKYRGCDVWPQNNARVTRGRTFVGRKGVPDIIGWSRQAVFTAAEVKTVTDKLSDDQKQFLGELERAGGIALIAHQDASGAVQLTPYGAYCLTQLNK